MLGAVAFRALTGTPVWHGATPAEILADAAAGDLAHVPERLAELPPPVAAVLAPALVGEPDLRCTAAIRPRPATQRRAHAGGAECWSPGHDDGWDGPSYGRSSVGEPSRAGRASSDGPAPVGSQGGPRFPTGRRSTVPAAPRDTGARGRANPSGQSIGPADLATAARTLPPVS